MQCVVLDVSKKEGVVDLSLQPSLLSLSASAAAAEAAAAAGGNAGGGGKQQGAGGHKKKKRKTEGGAVAGGGQGLQLGDSVECTVQLVSARGWGMVGMLLRSATAVQCTVQLAAHQLKPIK